jgi:hypothetical protein
MVFLYITVWVGSSTAKSLGYGIEISIQWNNGLLKYWNVVFITGIDADFHKKILAGVLATGCWIVADKGNPLEFILILPFILSMLRLITKY